MTTGTVTLQLFTSDSGDFFAGTSSSGTEWYGSRTSTLRPSDEQCFANQASSGTCAVLA